MLSLIWREMHDNMVGVVTPFLAGGIMIALAVYIAVSQGVPHIVAPLGMLTLVLLIGFCALGAAQMYGDRANRISSLLSTRGVTRRRIFAARVFVGVLTVLISFLPVTFTIAILLAVSGPSLTLYWRLIVELSVTAILAGFACHAIGLLIGWTTSKAWLLVGNLLLAPLLVSLVWIKGFGPEAAALLLLVIGAILLRVWRTFAAVSL